LYNKKSSNCEKKERRAGKAVEKEKKRNRGKFLL